MITATATSATFEVYPFGEYKVRLTDIQVKPKNPQYIEEGKDDQQWMWRFEVLEPADFAGKPLTQWSNRTIGQGATARPWVEGLLGRNLQANEEIVLDDLIGSEMYVRLNDRNKNGDPRNKIMSCRPLTEGTTPATASAPLTANGGSVVAQRTVEDLFPEDKEEGPVDARKALSYPRRWATAKKQVAEMYGEDELPQLIAQTIGEEKASTPFAKLQADVQKKLVEQFEAFADGSDSPF